MHLAVEAVARLVRSKLLSMLEPSSSSSPPARPQVGDELRRGDSQVLRAMPREVERVGDSWTLGHSA